MISHPSFRGDTRAVSFQIGTILALAILSVLIGGVVMTTGNFVSDTQHDATTHELQVVGERLAGQFMVADQLAQQGSDTTFDITPNVPSQVAGSQYTVELQSTGPQRARLILTTENPSISVQVPFRHTTPIEEGTISGQNIAIVRDTTGTIRLSSE